MVEKFNSYIKENYVNISGYDEKSLLVNFLETELKKLDLSRFYIESNNWNETKEDYESNRKTRLIMTIVLYEINIKFTGLFEDFKIINNYFQEFDLNLGIDNTTDNIKITFFYNDKLRDYYESSDFYRDYLKSKQIKKFKI